VGPIQLLTTRGSSSGREHTVPVVPVDHDDKTWLVAAYGVVDWVRNTRSTQRVRLRYGRTERRYRTREASPHEAAPVLKRYLAIAPKARPQFATPPEAPAEQFVAEAARHPVFELTGVEPEAG
jgi:deazaflavin-dependent oxidoreductase (nitroreductase family)